MGEETPTIDETSTVGEGAETADAPETQDADGAESTNDPSQEGKPKEEAPKDDSDEPPVRKKRTNEDWVKLRQQRKAERDAKKAEQGEPDDEQDDNDLSPEDAKVIDKRVQKHLEPIMKQQEQAELRSEINEFITDNPEFKQFAEKAERWAQNEVWRNIPTKQLMYAVAGENLLRIGAERREAADARALKTRTAGGNVAKTSSKSVQDMSDAEFQKEVDKVLHSGR